MKVVNNFNSIKQDFSDAVLLDKRYKRISYDIWRKLPKDNDLQLIFYADTEKICINSPAVESQYLNINDESFGQYLYERFFKTTYIISCNYDGTHSSTISGDYDYPTLISSDCYISTTTDYNKEKEDENMDFMKKFDFGPCTKDNVRISPYGLAVRSTSGPWVSYDAKNNNLMDVDVFNFEGQKFLFKLPVAIKDIKVGDLIIHNRTPMYVTSLEKGVEVVDIVAGERKIILPVTSPFGFDFYTKVVNLFEGFVGNADTDSPFGNMLPFFLLNEGNMDTKSLLMLSMLQGGKNDFMSNPLALYLFMGDCADANSMLPLFLLNSNFGAGAGTK